MLNNAIAEYEKKLFSAERQQVLTDVRIHALSELKFRIASLRKANDVIDEIRSSPEKGSLAMSYVAELLDGRNEGYETNEELVSAYKQAEAMHPDVYGEVVANMIKIKGLNSYPCIEEYIEDITGFIVAAMKFFILEREALFPLSKGGRKNDQQN